MSICAITCLIGLGSINTVANAQDGGTIYVGEMVCDTGCGFHDETCQCSHYILGPDPDIPGNTIITVKSDQEDVFIEQYHNILQGNGINLTADEVNDIWNKSKIAKTPINSSLLLAEIDLVKNR